MRAKSTAADYYVKQWPEKENNEMLWIIALLILGNICSLITGTYKYSLQAVLIIIFKVRHRRERDFGQAWNEREFYPTARAGQ